MADIRSKLNMLYSLEQLSSGENAFEKLHSLAKLICHGSLSGVCCITWEI